VSPFGTILVVAGGSRRREQLAEQFGSLAQVCCLQARGPEEAQALAGQDVELAVVDVAGQWDEARRVCRALRAAGAALPLLAVLQPEDAQALDLRSGVDDFLVEPYTAEELSARLRALAWRRDRLDQEGVIKIGDLVIDPEKYLVLVHGRPVDLTLKEYELLRFFAANRGRVFSRPEILSRVWGGEYLGGERTVDVHVRRLRAKLTAMADRLVTVHGIGYRLGS